MNSPRVTTNALRKEPEAPILPAGGPHEQAHLRRARRLGFGTLLDLSILLPLAFFLLFWNIGQTSFHRSDESFHVNVTQTMLKSGEWFTPRAFGDLYFNKPPFKMWLSAIPVSLLGESNLSYRIVDGLCGVLTALTLYFFSRRVFGSRLMGVIAVLGLLGSRSFMFYHVARMATQDSMLVLLLTLCFVTAWQFFERLRNGERDRLLTPALISGALVGLAVLTKSAAGLLPIPVLGLFALLSGDLRLIWRNAKIPALSGIAAAVLIPAAYFIPQLLAHAGAYDTIVKSEVLQRATEGFHNQNRFWFYTRRIFLGRCCVPPEILVAGSLFALFQVFKRSDRRYLYLRVWAWAPVALYTAVPSRLNWYIAPAYPAMALLCGAVMALTYHKIIELFRRDSRPVLQAGLVLLFLGGVIGLGQKIQFASAWVLAQPEHLALDQVVSEILQQSRAAKQPLVTLNYKWSPIALNERVYHEMLPRIVGAASPAELKQRFAEEPPSFLITSLENFSEVAAAGEFKNFALLPPYSHRPDWAVVFTYRQPGKRSLFVDAQAAYDLGRSKEHLVAGWGKPTTQNGLAMRPILEREAIFQLEGLPQFKKLGAKLRLNFFYKPAGTQSVSSEPRSLKVIINSTVVGEVSLRANRIETGELTIPPGVLRADKNLVFFLTHPAPSKGEPWSVAVNWMKFVLP